MRCRAWAFPHDNSWDLADANPCVVNHRSFPAKPVERVSQPEKAAEDRLLFHFRGFFPPPIPGNLFKFGLHRNGGDWQCRRGVCACRSLEGRKAVGVQNLSTRTRIGNPISEWKILDPLKPDGRPSGDPHTDAPSAVISVVTGFALAKGHSFSDASAFPHIPAPSSWENGKGKLGPHLGLLQEMLGTQPRAKIRSLYLALKERGYLGSYDLVKKKIHAMRRELGGQVNALFLSGDEPHAQVEIFKLALKVPEGMMRSYLFTMVLGGSGRSYAELMENCDMASFLIGHQHAFDHFGGVPAGIFYDPRESSAMRRLVGGFPFHMPLMDCGRHYGYAAKPTPAFAPWMKGRLKRPGKVLRKLFFQGYAFASLDQANADMRSWLALRAKMQKPLERTVRNDQERLGPVPPAGFNFLGRRQFLRLRP
jgi:transposase